MNGAWSSYSKFEVWGNGFELRASESIENKTKEFGLNLEGTGEYYIKDSVILKEGWIEDTLLTFSSHVS